MTRQRLSITIWTIIVFYLLAVMAVLMLFYCDKHPEPKDKLNYIIYKDLIPLIIAIPAASLTFCFQRSSIFLQASRQIWTDMIIAVNNARQYTHRTTSTNAEYGETLSKLSISIEQVRGLYKNVKSTKNSSGLYPYESIKTIYDLISDLGHGDISVPKAETIRKQINFHWKNLRETFLSEFDRSVPTIFDSPYIIQKDKKG